MLDRVRPAGTLPAATLHEYGGLPPVASSCWEYAVPDVPGSKEGVVMPNGATTVMVNPREELPAPLSETPTVNE